MTASFRFGKFELLPQLRSLRRGTDEIHLREKVFQVLVYLVANHDRVVSKDELIQAVWAGAAVTDDVLFRCIIDIRSALEDDRRTPRYIRTVPKAGYRFVASVEIVNSEAAVRGRPRWSRWAAGAGISVVLAATVWMLAGSLMGPPEAGRGESGWWRFDEDSGDTVRDLSPSGLDGRMAGAVERIPGKTGRGIRLNGEKGWIEGEDPRGSLPRDGLARTIAMWMRTSSTNGEDTNLFRYGEPGFPELHHFGLYLTERGYAGFGCGNTNLAVRSAAPVADGEWHFLAGVYDGAPGRSVRLYVDGVNQAEGRLPAPPATPARGPWLAGGTFLTGTCFRGDLDDVRVYRRALSPSEVQALHRCTNGSHDATAPDGRPLFFLPIHGNAGIATVAVESPRPGEASAAIRNLHRDMSGIQFALAENGCPAAGIRGAAVGQDLYLSVDLKVPRSSPENLSLGGPYFRSRAAAPGDGIEGGTSAGYAVLLNSEGMLKVFCLNPHETIAHSPAIPGFDSSRFHRLEIAARGAELHVALDGIRVEFERDGRRVKSVAIPAAWEGPPAVGANQGTAGVAFRSHPRNHAGGQEARNIILGAWREL